MSRKLTYFNVPGYAEAIRFMLHYGGMKFEDVKFDYKDWPVKEIKDGKLLLPIYEEDGRTLNQSMAIARYVASQTGLLPEDAWEQAQLDAAVLNIYDIYKKLNTHANEEEEKKKALVQEALTFFFSRFERDHKVGNGYFSGELSWADFILTATVISLNSYLKTAIEKDYPKVKALYSKITNLSGVKEYIANRQFEQY